MEFDLEKAARCGEASYIWRAGQDRRLQMIVDAAGDLFRGNVLENGCGVGLYLERLADYANTIIGLEYDFERAQQASTTKISRLKLPMLCAAGEGLPFQNGTFSLILSHEVLEHVQDDRASVSEMVRVLHSSGRIAIFVPNRGYPFETHGMYWHGRYRFGNIPLINYLPRRIRDDLAPHVRIYSFSDLEVLFEGLPVRFVKREVIYGGYDNIIARWPRVGRAIRAIFQGLEKTPLQFFGLSHFWIVEKI